MNERSEKAIVRALLGYEPLASLIGDKAAWDEQDIDVQPPNVTLRTLSTRFPAAALLGIGGVNQSLIEIAVRDRTSTGASHTAGVVADALRPYESGPSTHGEQGAEIIIGSILLQDIRQGPPVMQQSYSKLLIYSVSYYD